MVVWKFHSRLSFLSLNLMKNKLAVYIHIPFCRKKCYYCDFLSFTSSEEKRREYLEVLVKELELYSDLLYERGVSSLYFGGGTPSLLSEKELEYLFSKVFEKAKPQGEITFEMNPEDVSPSKLKLLKNYGDFRISLGAQSFEEELLKLFGRNHGVDEIFRAVDTLDSLDFNNYSLDIIYAVTEKFNMDKNISAIKAIYPSHLSCYALELHPSRPLAKLIEEPNEDLYKRDWDKLKGSLYSMGYERYEISSFAREGRLGFHNLNYWKGGDYLGLGLGAHGYIHPYRYSNERNLRAYIERVEVGELPLATKDYISHQDKRFEKFMLGLRLVQGIKLEELYPLSPKEKKAMDKHLANGLLKVREQRLCLSEEGFDLINHVLVDFL